jgi:hypothetical protein
MILIRSFSDKAPVVPENYKAQAAQYFTIS